jgi:hypothetical protein
MRASNDDETPSRRLPPKRPSPLDGRMRPGLLGEIVERAADPRAYAAWQRQVAGTGYCAAPIRLVGRTRCVHETTGELADGLDSADEPDGTLLVACGNRRASRCPSCSATYRADTWQLVAAGLRGGKGIPETVADHPRLFVTLTAPSFGPVHTRRTNGERVLPCRRWGAKHCQHGRSLRCGDRHREDDARLGEPFCADCFDAVGVVVWNALLPQFWRRTTIALRRALARKLGPSETALRGVARISYTKVAEYQRRSAVHLHAVIRADGADSDGVMPPPAELTAELLAAAVREAVFAAELGCLPIAGESTPRVLRWGDQLDVAVLRANGKHGPAGVAGYVAKYATKSTEVFGALDRRITAEDLDHLKVPDHIRVLVRTCWRLGGQPQLAGLKLCKWAHMLGFGGHFSTRSRCYSATLRSLREARAAWRQRRRGELPPAPDLVRLSDWRYVGSGYRSTGEAVLAATAASLAREARNDLRHQREHGWICRASA